MKTAEEVADKLWEDCRGAPKASAIPFIKKALTAFSDERVKEALTEVLTVSPEEANKMAIEERDEWIKEARAEALEEAAEVTELCKQVYDVELSLVHAFIADKIRSLQPDAIEGRGDGV